MGNNSDNSSRIDAFTNAIGKDKQSNINRAVLEHPYVLNIFPVHVNSSKNAFYRLIF